MDVIVIGSGFAGMSAASFLAKSGATVRLVERHLQPGGRARRLQAEGFSFDMGPSWYWMPDVFERYFASFGKAVTDYYLLERLDPSYRVFWPESVWDIPAGYEALQKLFESVEPGSAKALDMVLEEAAYKYRVGMEKLVYKPGQHWMEFADMELASGVFRLDVFTSVKKHIARHFKNPQIRELLEFPVLFLGALAAKMPALYTLMNYADIKGGTWYPKGGMYAIVEAMHSLAESLGVQFYFGHDVQRINVSGTEATGVDVMLHDGTSLTMHADVVVSAADYHFTETALLPPDKQSYSKAYWDARVMAPSCLLYYVGINKKVAGLQHHSLFFDVPFERHAHSIYTEPAWPSEPLFYVSATSVSDATQAPEGCENLFFLIPVAPGLKGDDEQLRREYFDKILQRFNERTAAGITRDDIGYYKSYSVSNFKEDYHAFKGNAYGLANTLKQTAILKPSCRSRKLDNLFYTGQLTVPGPGVPPSLISGEVVATQVIKNFAIA